jgi:hypothetical protein
MWINGNMIRVQQLNMVLESPRNFWPMTVEDFTYGRTVFSLVLCLKSFPGFQVFLGESSESESSLSPAPNIRPLVSPITSNQHTIRTLCIIATGENPQSLWSIVDIIQVPILGSNQQIYIIYPSQTNMSKNHVFILSPFITSHFDTFKVRYSLAIKHRNWTLTGNSNRCVSRSELNHLSFFRPRWPNHRNSNPPVHVACHISTPLHACYQRTSARRKHGLMFPGKRRENKLPGGLIHTVLCCTKFYAALNDQQKIGVKLMFERERWGHHSEHIEKHWIKSWIPRMKRLANDWWLGISPLSDHGKMVHCHVWNQYTDSRWWHKHAQVLDWDG